MASSNICNSSRQANENESMPTHQYTESDGYARWFVIQGTDQNKTIFELSPFL